MTSELRDWQLAIRERLRQQTLPLVLAGALLTYFGWVGGWVLPTGSIQRVAAILWIGAFKVGGPVLLALAAVSWSGWRVWLLADGVVGVAIAFAFGFYGVVSMFSGAVGFNAVLSFVFAVMFGTSAFSTLSFFRAAAGVPLFGGVKVAPSAGPAPPPRDATPYQGKSLAGELMQRTRGMPEQEPPPPVARPVDSRADAERPGAARPIASAQPPSRPIADARRSTPAHPAPPPPVESPQPSVEPPATSTPPVEASLPPPAPPPTNAPDGFLAALAREEEEDDDTSRG